MEVAVRMSRVVFMLLSKGGTAAKDFYFLDDKLLNCNFFAFLASICM